MIIGQLWLKLGHNNNSCNAFIYSNKKEEEAAAAEVKWKWKNIVKPKNASLLGRYHCVCMSQAIWMRWHTTVREKIKCLTCLTSGSMEASKDYHFRFVNLANVVSVPLIESNRSHMLWVFGCCYCSFFSLVIWFSNDFVAILPKFSPTHRPREGARER